MLRESTGRFPVPAKAHGAPWWMECTPHIAHSKPIYLREWSFFNNMGGGLVDLGGPKEFWTPLEGGTKTNSPLFSEKASALL